MERKTIGICCDHAGYEMKEFILTCLEKWGMPFKDYGTYSAASCDYPDFAHAMAKGMENGDIYPGIAICGSGNGIAMTLNKHQSIRAALCWTETLAVLTRAHNDANVVVLPGRFISKEEGEKIVSAFLSSAYEGGRHQQRIEKIALSE